MGMVMPCSQLLGVHACRGVTVGQGCCSLLLTRSQWGPALSFLKGRSADLQELDEPDRKLLSVGKAGIKREVSSNIIVD